MRDGKLTGTVAEPILGREAKVAALHEITARLGLSLADVIAVGDGANDLGMLGLAGSGRGAARQAQRGRAVRHPDQPWRPDRTAVPAGLQQGRMGEFA